MVQINSADDFREVGVGPQRRVLMAYRIRNVRSSLRRFGKYLLVRARYLRLSNAFAFAIDQTNLRIIKY
jgi:hypothetical protein